MTLSLRVGTTKQSVAPALDTNIWGDNKNSLKLITNSLKQNKEAECPGSIKLTLVIAVIAIVGLIGYTLLRSKVGADVANRSNKSNEELSVGNFKDISKDILSYYSINPKDSFAFMSPLTASNSGDQITLRL